MALRTADYIEMGRASAKRDERPEDCALRDGSWQKAAWEAGYGSWVRERHFPAEDRKAKTLGVMLDARRAESFALWPKAAAEHFRLLAHDIATCKSVERQQRLMRAVNRMVRRHGKPQRPTTGNEVTA